MYIWNYSNVDKNEIFLYIKNISVRENIENQENS